MISTGTGFKVLSRDSIDERFILSKDQMLNIDEAVQPENYFCVCTDDSMLYVYNVNNPVDAETGKFRKVGSNESVDPSIFQKSNDDSLMTEDKTIVGAINELENIKLDKPETDGAPGQILVLQDDGSLAYQDNVSEFDDTELQEAVANKLDKPETDGVAGQILVLQDDGSLAYADNVSEYDDTAIQEELDNKLDKPETEGVAGQILVLQDDGSLAYADNISEFDDTELQEAVANKLDKPETEGTAGQILVLQDDGSLAYQDNVSEFDDTELQEAVANKLDKPEVDGTAGQILVLQDDGSLAYADNVTEFDDTEIQEELDTKLDKPEVDGTAGQILVLQDDGSLAYADNVTEYDDTEIQEELDTKISKPEIDGTAGQILVLQDDGTLAYQDNVTVFDDTELRELIDTKITKPETDGTPGQILVLQDDNTLAYQDNVTAFDDTELRDLIDTKVDKVDGSSLVADTEIAKIHEHANQDVLDNLTKDADSGKLLFEGTPISADVNIATVDAVGTVKPDGTSITIADDGTITAVGGGGSAALIEDITTNIEVGGIKSGTLLGTGLTFNDYVRMVHVTYLAPGVTLTITPSTTLYKVGTTVTGLVAKVTVTKKSENITKIEFLVNDVVKETITTDVANGGTFNYTVDDFSTDTTIKAIVYDASSNVPKTSTVKFVNPYYCGTTDDVPTADTVVTLTELVETKGSKTRTVTCSNKHVVIAYPASYGKLTSILDGNGFENLTDYTNIQETVNGVGYEIYYTTGKKTLTNFKYTYK
jgi:hypothetical protein